MGQWNHWSTKNKIHMRKSEVKCFYIDAILAAISSDKSIAFSHDGGQIITMWGTNTWLNAFKGNKSMLAQRAFSIQNNGFCWIQASWISYLLILIGITNHAKHYLNDIRITHLDNCLVEKGCRLTFYMWRYSFQTLVRGHVGTHLFLITLYVAQGAGMGIHLWRCSWEITYHGGGR